MNTLCVSLCVPFLVFTSEVCSAGHEGKGKQVSQKTEHFLKIIHVDVLDRVFSDMTPMPAAYKEAISVPRGGKVAFQFAVISNRPALCKMSLAPIIRADGKLFLGRAKLYKLLPVHVEANTQGSMKTRVGGKPPAGWMKYFVRKAPFDVAEVLVEANTLQLKGGVTRAVLADITVPRDAEPGLYSGVIELEAEGESASSQFSFRVHKTIVPPDPILHSTHWFWPEPKNLTNQDPPEWWSERHWELLVSSARQLRSFGQDTILTPLVNYEHPLIQIIRQEDGTYNFDYGRFDRWFETFQGLGFKIFEGYHIASLSSKGFGGVFVLDRKTGKKESISREAWLNLIPIFYESFYKHLKEKGWTDCYIQHQLDEPKDDKLYERLAALAKKYIPRIQTIDAINSRPEVYSPLVGIHVFNLVTLVKCHELADARRSQGKRVWLYHCTSPYPPYPNRHLDRPLSECRLWPLLCYMLKADGFLYWAANMYRGADEYKTSIGPLPNGSQNPGHPPGDDWFFYRSPNGLRGSMRMVAFRDGLLDHMLLTMLGGESLQQANEILRGVVRSATDYEKEPRFYHRARKALLTALDKQ